MGRSKSGATTLDGGAMNILLAGLLFLSITFLTYFPGFGSSKKLVLAHNNPQDHPVHRGLVDFAQKLKEISAGKYEIIVYPSEILGREREVLELIQVGALSFTKVSSSSLENFNPLWSVINLPYIFESSEHHFRVLDGEVGNTLLNILQDNKIQGLAFSQSTSLSAKPHSENIHYLDSHFLTPQLHR